jgi:hypothetical protein
MKPLTPPDACAKASASAHGGEYFEYVGHRYEVDVVVEELIKDAPFRPDLSG